MTASSRSRSNGAVEIRCHKRRTLVGSQRRIQWQNPDYDDVSTELNLSNRNVMSASGGNGRSDHKAMSACPIRAAIPKALPAIVTVDLSLGVRRMAATNAIPTC
jgi:hypothetical protein